MRNIFIPRCCPCWSRWQAPIAFNEAIKPRCVCAVCNSSSCSPHAVSVASPFVVSKDWTSLHQPSLDTQPAPYKVGGEQRPNPQQQWGVCCHLRCPPCSEPALALKCHNLQVAQSIQDSQLQSQPWGATGRSWGTELHSIKTAEEIQCQCKDSHRDGKINLPTCTQWCC